MSIEVTTHLEEPEYPKLRISPGGLIVLFTSWGEGTVIRPNKNKENYIGRHRTDWYGADFKDYTGEINIRNK